MTSKYERALRMAVKQSTPTKTVYELLMAADAEGDSRATYALATWFLFGSSPFTPVNKRRAVQLLKKATKGGIADAAHDLAVAYENGDGVKKSLRLAFESNMHAALLGDAQSFHEVGRMYYYGIGTPRNRRLADHWLAKAEALRVKEVTRRDSADLVDVVAKLRD